MKAIEQFLITAKQATYAGKGPAAEPTRPQSHDLQYSEGNLQYIDTYLGSAKFAGEEALWKDGRPFWAMNYIGRVLDEGFSSDFLKEALRHVPADMPFRGPAVFRRERYTYKCTVNGDFAWFSGREEIWSGEVRVYECVFHGGEID
ncbi:DUF5680 domain-containing protein [Paenibacillus tengchongensis]|uniref:DUF5680 domain-containing protein n=1 Tax=Paenibacillus tengchongensis TaxID=2608684 RepID=UPI00124CFF90|nr:DUF5680 domain-containing protein [Paenibacillus tengchongensis]